MTEVVAISLHRQTIDTNRAGFLFGGVELAVMIVVIVACFRQNAIGNKVLACAVGFDNRLDEVFRHVLIVCQELFGVFRQAVASVAEGRIVVLRTNTRIETHAVDDVLRVQAFHLGVCIEFVEIAHTECQIGIGKQFDGFGFGQSHDTYLDILFDRTFLE